MAKTVRVRVGDYPDAPVKTMNESAALRLIQTSPKMYRILEPPKIEVVNLPPLETQKKSVVVAAEENKEPVKEQPKPEEKRKPGRPKEKS